MEQRRRAAAEVRNALRDPARLCRALGLEGPRQAHGLFVRCPAHAERTASCSVTRGPDGTVRVKCFGCDLAGDALTLIQAVRGFDFRDALAEGARIAGLYALEGELQAGRLGPDRPPLPPPPPERERQYPDRASVSGLWGDAVRVTHCAAAARMLEGRAIDAEDVGGRDLARVLRITQTLPRWACYRGQSWLRTGHRLVLPMWDADGNMRSLRAWRIGDHESPKRLPPAGCRATGLVLANTPGNWLLSGRYTGPHRVVIVEGEPDFLTWSVRVPGPVFGLVSGSWTRDFAIRLPRGCDVIVRTHHDPAGDRYARQVIESLHGHCSVSRSEP